MDSIVRVLTRIFWVAASLLAAIIVVSSFISGILIGTLGERTFVLIVGILIAVVMLCSGFLTWHEFCTNPIRESERGEWTGRALLYAIVFTITFFLAFLYLPAIYFG